MRQFQITEWAGGIARIAVALVVVLAGTQVHAQPTTGITVTKHNLGSGGPGPNKVGTGDTAEVCVFCHTPHGATSSNAPLWNKALPAGTSYTMYNQTNSSTLDGQLTTEVGGVSLACLSCHDGSQAMDNIVNAPGSGGYDATGGGAGGLAYTWNSGGTVDSTGTLLSTAIANLGKDLSNDHPIGIQYCGGGPTQVSPGTACNDKDFNAPASTLINSQNVFWVDTTGGTTGRDKSDMILYNRTFGVGVGPSVECASCHDPHAQAGQGSPAAGATFLRISNSGSAVCLACHVK